MVNEDARRRIAYFSMEVGLESGMPSYSGGLGVLAGDTLRAAADLGLPVVGVSLLYRQGFFRQHLDIEGFQTESAYTWQPESYLEHQPVRVRIGLGGRDIHIAAWVYHIQGVTGSSVPVYFLDSDLPENDFDDCGLTGHLYGGDQGYRLRQEALLAFGGLALLRALGHTEIETFHMNEGHCSLVAMGLLAERLEGDLASAGEDDYDAVRQRCVFTTHTPVPAGHDRFHFGLAYDVLGEAMTTALTRLPSFEGSDTLNMTYLALFFARYVNGVSRQHGEIAQAMYPGYDIHSITNGVHAAMWMSPAFASLFDREIPGWRVDNVYLRQALDIHLEHVLETHAQAKRDLFAEIQSRVGVQLNPSVMTIGFARRAATYKRADFIFSSYEELRTIVNEAGPLQFVFAGKAHPHDEPAKALIHRVFEARDQLQETLPVVYLPEHDMALGKLLTSGVDLWLNNPQKPLEASGTSGMKAALNGVPSFSVLDGWWPEGWVEGVTGWSIGNGGFESDEEDELASLYTKLRHVIVPLYYGSPTGYARVMRSTIAVNGAYFTAQRMMQQYLRNAYTLNTSQTSDESS